MMYKAKDALSSEIRKKHLMQSKDHVEFLNVKRGYASATGLCRWR
jgi:hypothetical protein